MEIGQLKKRMKRSRSLAEVRCDDPFADGSPTTMTMLPASQLFFYFERPEYEELKPTLWKELAIKALKYYHETQGVKLELSGEVRAAHTFYVKIWAFHLAFQATSEGGDSKRMFAEVFRCTIDGKCIVKFCNIMDPKNGLVGKCTDCPKAVIHPRGVKFFKFPTLEEFAAIGG